MILYNKDKLINISSGSKTNVTNVLSKLLTEGVLIN